MAYPYKRKPTVLLLPDLVRVVRALNADSNALFHFHYLCQGHEKPTPYPHSNDEHEGTRLAENGLFAES